MTHDLKTWPVYFQAIWDGRKNFEVRQNDRDYKVGDELRLVETDSLNHAHFTGRTLICEVEYILHGGQFGIEPGYCVMSLEVINKTP